MLIPEVRRQEILAKLISSWGADFRCPLCKGKDMGLSDRIFEVHEHRPDNGGHMVPLLFVACLKCGYTIPVNALMLGVVPASKEGQKNAEETKAV